MKNTTIIQILIGCILLLYAAIGSAVTVDVNQDTISAGQSVSITATITVSGTAGPMPSATLTIDFGDKSSQDLSVRVEDNNTETFVISHTYSQPGRFEITASAPPFDPSDPVHKVVPPLSDSETILVVGGLSQPPRATVAEQYKHQFSLSRALNRTRYQVSRGSLPPGLSLSSNGLISGIPTKKGEFSFTVRAVTTRRAIISEQVRLTVDPGNLVVRVAPSLLDLSRGGSSNQRVTFTVVAPTIPLQETIVSTRGEFRAQGRVLGYVSSQMRINLNSSSPSLTETITIPNNVFQAAQRLGESQVTYGRSFTSPNLNKGYGDTKVSLITQAAGNLRISKIRVFFEQNNRPLILVEKNRRDLRGVVDIHYNGTGTFKGYWQVGKRILERVQKNIYYGKILTLKTPDAPPLPTYSEGAHRLQFIITQPEKAQSIIFPEAIYHVEAKKAEIIVPLSLISPSNNAEISLSGDTFSWTEAPKVSTYQVEFYKIDQELPFFKAYTRKGVYGVSANILKMKFAAAKNYFWQVKGYNDAGELAAESSRKGFSLLDTALYVPGQILFLVDNNADGKNLIARLDQQFGLKVLEKNTLVSINRVLVVCYTNGNVQSMIAQLQKVDGLYNPQPNYIFSTMSDEDPLRSMQSIHSLVDLDSIHVRSQGKNVRVAIIDTGVDIEHRDLKDRISSHLNFVADSAYQSEIHGTAVASIIGASRNDFGILGIAPGSEILAYRACRQKSSSKPEGECYSTSLARAVDAAIVAKAHIANISIGAEIQDNLLSRLIKKGSKQGVLFVAPVGNNPRSRRVSFPASHPDVTSVAGFDEKNKPLPNALLAKKADAVAPAQNIFASTPGDKHNFLNGTSFSAATISGLLALSVNGPKGPVSQTLPHYDKDILWDKQVKVYMGE